MLAAGGTETPDDDGTVDDEHGLPMEYTFTQADAGIHTFTGLVRFRMAGVRELRAEDTVRPGVIGTQSGITVLPASLLMGALWDTWSPEAAFYVSAAIGTTAALLLALFVRPGKRLGAGF